MKRIISVLMCALLISSLFPSYCLAKEYETFYFGIYPQSLVTDVDILEVLNSDESSWMSYNYCYGVNYEPVHGDYMKYKDVVYNGTKYRGVYFSEYRPYFTYGDFGLSPVNSYEKNTYYWFRYEPIEWIIIDEESGLVVTSEIIDTQFFADDSCLYITDKNFGYYSDSTCTYAANNYEVSSIRNFLNSNFYVNSFSEEEKEKIKETALDVSDSEIVSEDSFCSEHIFLLSKSELENTSYFDSTLDFCSPASDYALCQGLVVDSSGVAESCISRTACDEPSVYAARSSGTSMQNPWSLSGIRPGMYISEIDVSCDHNYIMISQESATCTKEGKSVYTCSKCNETYTDIIPARGHDEEILKGYDATCKDKGLTDGKICRVCQTVTVPQVEIPLSEQHSKQSFVEAVEPGCTTCGYTAGVICDICGIYTLEPQEIKPNGHTFKTYKNDCNATCTDNSTETAVCEYCSATDTREIPATSLGHTGGCANCVDQAVCTRCKTPYGDVNPDNHKSVVEDKAVAATCTATGLTAGSHCESCNRVITAQQETEITNHSYVSTVINPDCVNKGYTVYSCKNCTATYIDNYTDALGHTGGCANCVDQAVCTRCGASYGNVNPDNHKSVVEDKAVAATCAATGLTAGSHCESCNRVITKQQETEITNHSYVSTVINPDCVNKGYTVYSCKNCTATYIDNYTDALSHTGGCANCVDQAVCTRCGVSYGNVNPDNHKSVVEDKAVTATCTATGLTAGSHCESCNRVITAQQETENTNHSYVSTVINPDCVNKGYTVYSCKNCTATYIDNYTDALGHTGGCANCVDQAVCTRCKTPYGDVNPDNHKSVVEDNPVPATCTTEGMTYGSHCSVCNSIIVKQQIINKSTHIDSDTDGFCDLCGEDTRTDSQKKCNHLCHKNGLLGFVWKCINTFNKLFKIKKYCECGLRHW